MNASNLQDKLRHVIRRLVQFRVPLFLSLLALVYGFVIWRVGSLYYAQPSQSDIASQRSLSMPHIDKATLDKVKQLQDNSVSVQALFNQARQNPFAE